MESTHRIPMADGSAYDREHYGVTHRSAFVYRHGRGSGPARVVTWSNTHRLNPRNGQPVRYGDMGPRDGGNGVYLDPRNRATDSPTSVLISLESTVITNSGTNTGTVASGQVYAPDGATLRDGDVLTLVYPDGTEVTYTARFPRMGNGHGHAEEMN